MQVVDHRLDRGGLVRRFLETETGGERLVIVRRQFELVSLAQRALRIQVQQFGGGIAHLLHRAAFCLVPRAAAQLVQRRGFRRAAAVAADQVQLRDRHVELVLAGVFQQQEFVLAFAEVEIDQPLVARDAVLFVDHRIADLEFGQVAQHAFDIGFLCRARGTAARLRGIQFGFRDQRKVVVCQDEAVLQRRNAEHELFVA